MIIMRPLSNIFIVIFPQLITQHNSSLGNLLIRSKLPISVFILHLAMACPSSASEIEIVIDSPAPLPIEIVTDSPAPLPIEIVIESSDPPDYPQAANDFEASTSASMAVDTNENSSISYGHDVFISHRGPDVKKTFASYLYHRLRVHDVGAFLDKPEMQEGESVSAQIKGAIATAAVHVAIFSPGYADSRWCLDELVDMLQSEAPIIPVFYNVTPLDLRRTDQGVNGVYADALRNLEMKTTYDSEIQEQKPRYSSKTIENWRKALASVSKISGLELNAFDGDEGVLLEKLVECLLKRVKKKEIQVYVADYPTGLDKTLEHFEGFLSGLPESKPRVAAIVGPGGIGKTTMAKEFFNRKSSCYRTSCFLFDVRNAAESGGSSLVSLQKELLQGLFGKDCQIDSVDNGKQKLISCFESFSHGMLILDNVDHVHHLEALLPGEVKDTFPSNCLILITSRSKYNLLASGIQHSSIYTLSGLGREQSMELFCRHAFRQPHPIPGFQNLVDRILRICDGLPLYLKVSGSHFRVNRDETYWEGELSRIHEHPDIQQILKISYDSLDKEEKQLFLYISCFLIEEKMDTAIKVWDQSGWTGFSVFQNLRNKSLVEVDSENCIHMHDHLRELGRGIAQSSGFRIPCLWDRTENSNIGSLLQMLERSDNRNVRGIRMVPSADVGLESKSYASSRSDMAWFKKIRELLKNPVTPGITMHNLQLLVTEDQLLEIILRTVALPNLRLLRWYKCGHSSLPSWIPKENLRVLYLVGNALKILWQDKAQAPLQLRQLEILAPLSNLPKSIGELKQLEQIYIGLPEENDMRSLPDEFCQLSSLKRFELTNAWKMKSLPDSFGNLVNLEYLNLSCCRSLGRLPDSFENLIRLKYLDLRGSDSLIISTRAHENIARWRQRHVQEWVDEEREWRDKWLERRSKISRIWLPVSREWVEEERKWRNKWRERRSRMSREWVEEEREWRERRSRMSRIGLLLSRIRMSLIRLVLSPQIWLVLAFLVCSSSLFVAIFCRYPLILDTMCLVEIVRWKWLHHKDNLKWALMILASTLPFNLFLQATHLPVPRRREVTILLWILCILMIIPYILILWVDIVREWWWEREERMWEAWMAERECAASEWPRMRETSDRASLRHLRQEMNQLPRSLKELHITELPSTFENLSNLEVLELDGSFSKMLPPSLSVLSNLKELRLVACPRLMCLPDSLGLLSVLEVKCCSGLVEVGTLPSTLIHLSLISCLNLKKIDGLCGLTKLQTLNISGWREVEELAGIETLVSLEQLRASGCENMQRIRGLGKLTKLKQLDVHGCSEIEELEGVEHLTLLEKLDASDCPALHWDGKVLEQLPRRLKEGMLYI